MTGATLAIAETGSVVLQNVAGQGRRAVTLVPDYHLCLVRVADVVETVPEADEAVAGDGRVADNVFFRTFGDGGYRDDANQRRAWAAISGCHSAGVRESWLGQQLLCCHTLAIEFWGVFLHFLDE